MIIGYISRLETPGFVFESHGETEEDANEAMGPALFYHAMEKGLRVDWWDEYQFTTTPIIFGSVTRNGVDLSA